jgi:hypothetical protein
VRQRSAPKLDVLRRPPAEEQRLSNAISEKPAEFIHQQGRRVRGYASRGVPRKPFRYGITRASGMAIIRQLVRL